MWLFSSTSRSLGYGYEAVRIRVKTDVVVFFSLGCANCWQRWYGSVSGERGHWDEILYAVGRHHEAFCHSGNWIELFFKTKRHNSCAYSDLGNRVSWYWNQDRCQAGEGSFCCKSVQNMFKNVLGPLAASWQVYTFRAMQYIWVKNDFFTI
jgi:hypothetical protein